jgi:hypothetical protein
LLTAVSTDFAALFHLNCNRRSTDGRVVALALAALAPLSVLVMVAPVRPPGRPAKAAITRATCGVERWDVTTLADPRAHLVDPRPHPSTVGTVGAPRREPRREGVGEGATAYVPDYL